MQIIVKNYEHHNRAFKNWDSPKGKYIKTKDDYDRAMKEQGMVSYEKMQQMASEKKLKEYKLSEQSKEIIKTAKNCKDKRGNVKLSDKTVDAMVKIGAIGKKIPEYMGVPSSSSEGGFYKI